MTVSETDGDPRRPTNGEVAKATTNTVGVMKIVFDENMTVPRAQAIVDYVRRQVQGVKVSNLGVDDRLYSDVSATGMTSKLTDTLQRKLHEVTDASVVRTARVDCLLDRAPNRVHIGTTVQLTFDPDQMPSTSDADIQANVPNSKLVDIRPSHGHVVVNMERPSDDPGVVDAFIQTLVTYLRTELTNPGYEIVDHDPNARMYPEFRWQPAEDPSTDSA